MKIGIDFNKDIFKTKENIDKLLSSGAVYEEENDEFHDYFLDVNTLEEFDEILTKIEKIFNYDVDFIISPDRLIIFLEFDIK